MHALENEHIELGLQEGRQAEPTAFEYWVEKAEERLGHDLDGSQDEEGYSLDEAFAAFKAGESSTKYAAHVKSLGDIDTLMERSAL